MGQQILNAILEQISRLRVNWVAVMFDPDFHTAVTSLIAILRKHSTVEDGTPAEAARRKR